VLKEVREELEITYREAVEAIDGTIGSLQAYERPNVTHRRFLRYLLYLAKQKKMGPRAFKEFIQELADELPAPKD